MGNKIKQLSLELEQIAALVEQWGVMGVSEMEKDVVLERLRAVYQIVKLEIGEQKSCCADTPSSTDCGASAHPTAVDHQAKCDTEASECKPAEDQPAEQQEQDTPPAESIEPKEATPPAKTEEPVRIKLDRETLLSLYHSGDYSPDVAAKSIKERDAAAVPPLEVDIPKDIFDDLEHSDRRIVADVEPLQTVGDIYARNNHTVGMGEKISKDSTTELRKSIGINDRFQIIKEVFNGDQDIYDGVIDELESFSNLDEALLHIHENYNWNPNSEGVNRLIELLTKKLS